ncbi:MULTISPECIES: hypothetical protein [unclassified Streptosporangium]|uniref:hypothetical protein n=1 Tax=unclassified Streptosporangium TaxID=2632669 RepID=UPI002E2BE254|nr:MULTISPECIES: hypothetical protein [unclassified Streptosporangium]
MAALVLAVQTYLSRDQQPDLNIDPIAATGMASCLAGAVLLVANLTTSRDGRHGMPESLAGLPAGAEHRTRAVLFAAPLVGGLSAAVVLGLYLVIRLLSGPVAGTLDPYEPLTAVAVSAFAAALGVAVGRWLPWLISGPLVIAALGFLIFQNPVNGPAGWWLPVMQRHWPDWPDRPSGTHLVYVLALVVLAGGVASLRYGLRPAPLVAVVAAVAVAVPTGVTAAAVRQGSAIGSAWTAGDDVDPRLRDRFLGSRSHRCEERGGITYCAYPEYVPWIPLWEEAIGPVVRAVPPERRHLVPQVRQMSSSWFFNEDIEARAVRPSMSWGHPDQRKRLAEDLSLHVAGFHPMCDARGQARTLVMLWLIGQTAPVTRPQSLQIDSRLSRRSTIDYGDAEVGYAKRLLASPGARERVRAHWDTLMRPATTLERALPLLGLDREFPISKPEGTPCR